MPATGQRTRRSGLRELWDSTIGKKIAVAVSGSILLAYVVLHMAGNLNTLYGPGDGEARVDSYAEWLRDFGEPLLPHEFILWAVRVLLLGAVAVHITGIVQIRARSREARGGHPARRIGRSVSAATMGTTGLILVVFIVFHILQFTTLTIDVTPLEEGAVYANLYDAFQKWYFVLFYILGVGALGFHLRHGIWSALQTLGQDRPERNQAIRRTATALATILVIGFLIIPIACFTGIVSEPSGDSHAAAPTTVVNR